MEGECILKEQPLAYTTHLLANADDTLSEDLMITPASSDKGYAAELNNQNVTSVLEPIDVIDVGHKFETVEAIHAWYNKYAKKVGFSTKIYSSRKNMAGVACWKSFTFSKEGKTNKTYQNSHKEAFEQGVQRRCCERSCGCQARMNILKNHNGNGWKVTLFEASHNHVLSTPSKVHLLRLYRTVSATKKAHLQEYNDANIPTRTKIRLLPNDVGSPLLLSCTKKDI